MYFIFFDLCMAIIVLAIGILFYKSNGKGANYLSGYNMRNADERKKYDENKMCKTYGKRMIYMSIPFLAGAVIDYFRAGIGCMIAWGVYIILFVLLLVKRHRIEG